MSATVPPGRSRPGDETGVIDTGIGAVISVRRTAGDDSRGACCDVDFLAVGIDGESTGTIALTRDKALQLALNLLEAANAHREHRR